MEKRVVMPVKSCYYTFYTNNRQKKEKNSKEVKTEIIQFLERSAGWLNGRRALSTIQYCHNSFCKRLLLLKFIF